MSFPKDKKTHPNDRGFVLIATLALLGFAVVSVVIVTSLIRMQSDLIEAETYQSLSRQNALNALNIAIGQLQFSAGQDQVITTPAATILDMDLEKDSGNFWWTRAINIPNGKGEWLVSSPNETTPNPLQPRDPTKRITLVGQGSADPNNPHSWVTVDKVGLQTLPISTATSPEVTGHFAYWTGELNTRANVGLTDSISSAIRDPYQRTYNQLSIPRRIATESILPSIGDPDDPSTRQILSNIISPAQLFYLQQDRDELHRNYHNFTTDSHSVLSNPITGGLKINLSDPDYIDTIVTPTIRKLITPEFYTSGKTIQNYQLHGDDEHQAFASDQRPTDEEPLAIHQPAITEFCLSLGLFHTQSDGRDRVKYHMFIEWLNPYPYDLGFSNSKPYVIIVDNLPKLEVTNESSGESFQVDLNSFDPQLRYNNLAKTKLNSWVTFDRLTKTNQQWTHGIDAGTVYRMSEPNHVTDENGLSRTLQQGASVWEWESNGPSVIGSRPPNKLYPSDRIRIRSITPVRMNLTVVPLNGENSIPSDCSPDDFLESHGYVAKFMNIPFEAINVHLSGSSYSRTDSSFFTPADYRIAFHFRLKTDHESLNQFSKTTSLRDPIFDLNNPSIRNLYKTSDPVAAARTVDPASNQLDAFGNHQRFWDFSNRENSENPNLEQYQFHLYDIPLFEPLSPGVFSQLHFHNRPHPWIASPNAVGSELNQIYDNYYFSGSKVSENWLQEIQYWEPNLIRAGLLANHLIRPVIQPDGKFPSEDQITGQQGAAYSLLEGGFNIFSASSTAWAAFLKNNYRNHAILKIETNQNSEIVNNVFSRLPFSSASIINQKADSSIPLPENRNKTLYRQGIRALDTDTGLKEDWIELLADSIIDEIRTEISSNDTTNLPITSLEDFINSGIIDRAINSPSVTSNGWRINGQDSSKPGNNNIDTINPGYLRQSDIFSMLGTQMAVRSDTFVIRAYGDAIHPRNKHIQARAYCEAVVQRMPQYINPIDEPFNPPTETLNLILGRRFKVVRFRWLQPHEI